MRPDPVKVPENGKRDHRYHLAGSVKCPADQLAQEAIVNLPCLLTMIPYTPPTPSDLQNLKNQLGLTGQQMAALASVSDGAQWRKYTGGANPRHVNLHMLFFVAARLALSDQELARVVEKMQEIGAGISMNDFSR